MKWDLKDFWEVEGKSHFYTLFSRGNLPTPIKAQTREMEREESPSPSPEILYEFILRKFYILNKSTYIGQFCGKEMDTASIFQWGNGLVLAIWWLPNEWPRESLLTWTTASPSFIILQVRNFRTYQSQIPLFTMSGATGVSPWGRSGVKTSEYLDVTQGLKGVSSFFWPCIRSHRSFLLHSAKQVTLVRADSGGTDPLLNGSS